MISLKSVSLIYLDHGKEVAACRDIELDVHPGEFLGILGPSGSGKSSLLYLLSGLKTPTRGSVTVDDKDYEKMSEPDRANLRLESFGFVFQYPYLIGYLSALENVRVGKPNANGSEEAEALLADVGIADKAHRLPHELSGGERQRVCIARALLGGKRFILADEPTASLDHRTGAQVVDLLCKHRGTRGLVMVTHDPSMLAHADRIVTMADGKLEDMPAS